jgi:hypothetical protein
MQQRAPPPRSTPRTSSPRQPRRRRLDPLTAASTDHLAGVKPRRPAGDHRTQHDPDDDERLVDQEPDHGIKLANGELLQSRVGASPQTADPPMRRTTDADQRPERHDQRVRLRAQNQESIS